MDSFQQIFDRAATFHGGTKVLEDLLPKPLSFKKLKAIPNDRWLAQMTKCVFRAGFSWKVIDNKWANFETAFDGFDAHKNAMKSSFIIKRGLDERTISPAPLEFIVDQWNSEHTHP